jgi:hypothetical protein
MGRLRAGNFRTKPVSRRPVQRSQNDRPAVWLAKRHARQLLELRIWNSPEVFGFIKLTLNSITYTVWRPSSKLPRDVPGCRC